MDELDLVHIKLRPHPNKREREGIYKHFGREFQGRPIVF